MFFFSFFMMATLVKLIYIIFNYFSRYDKVFK